MYHPVLHTLKNQLSDVENGGVTIFYCSKFQKVSGELDASSFTLTLSKEERDELPADKVPLMAKLFSWVSPIIIPQSVHVRGAPSLSPREVLQFALHDDRLITRCLWALAMGTMKAPSECDLCLNEDDDRNSYHQSQLLGCFAAADFLS